jgi:hypothetical protein
VRAGSRARGAIPAMQTSPRDRPIDAVGAVQAQPGVRAGEERAPGGVLVRAQAATYAMAIRNRVFLSPCCNYDAIHLFSYLMDVTQDIPSGAVTKRGRSAAERRQLASEAALLRTLAHPGVVRLVAVEGSDPPDALVLRRVPGGALSQLGTQPLEVIAGLGAAVATTVADLHDLGIQHRAIDAQHVLLDDQGRPVLCSFGRAQRDLPAARADSGRRQDVSALARLLLDRLDGGAPAAVHRTLRRAAGLSRRRRDGDARWLAHQLCWRVPGARLPDPSVEAGPSEPEAAPSIQPGPAARPPAHGRSRLWRPNRPVQALVLVAGLGFVILAVLVTSGRWSSSAAPAGRPRPCPQMDYGCRVIPTPAGVLTTSTGRYLVGNPGDLVVLGRWRCGPVALPAVLRPGTGQLWTFGAWPQAGHAVRGQLVASHVYGAWSLRVLVQTSGCDRIEIERRRQPPLTADVPR